MNKNIIQAYKQAPWRTQLQWVGIFLLFLVGIAAIAGLYLSISGRAAAAGRRIQVLESDINTLQLEINDRQTFLAEISSARALSERAADLDMTLLDPRSAMYVEVPGYQPASELVLAPAVEAQAAEKSVLLPEFTSSLWDWLKLKVWSEAAASPLLPLPTEVVP